MNFSLPPEVMAIRQRIREIVAATVTAEAIERQHRTGTFACQELAEALGDAGLLERALPGGGHGDPIELWLLFNELEMAGAPYDDLAVSVMVAGVVNKAGTAHQKEASLPGLLSGRERGCLGYSEPDSGSDVAACKTKAERDGDQWVINGSKMWTSLGHVADWMLLLTRTDPQVPKHRGLTMFLVPMTTPGITLEPVHTMGGERTNATFLDNVRVGDQWRLGEVNGGWSVMGVALAFERGVMGGTNTGVPLLRAFWRWALATGLAEDPVVREHAARAAIDNHVATLLTQKSAWIAATGGLPGTEGSMAKLYATKAYQQASARFLDHAGALGVLGFDAPGAAADGWVDYHARHSPVTTIYGGTSEISLNAVAERHLGLPRAR